MRVPIFYYHSVGGPRPWSLSLDAFRSHLDSLDRHGFESVTVARIASGGPLPPRAAALAFDDGLLDNYETVLPLLLERGRRATFYVVPGYDGVIRRVHPATGRWSDTPRPGYTLEFPSMGPAERRDLVSSGMEVGSHGLTHRRLDRLPALELAREIGGSKRRLEEELGVEVSTFCYPNGRFDLRVLREVRRAGYRGACSTLPGFAPGWFPLLMPRFLVESPDLFEGILTGRMWWPPAMLREWWRQRRRQASSSAGPAER